MNNDELKQLNAQKEAIDKLEEHLKNVDGCITKNKGYEKSRHSNDLEFSQLILENVDENYSDVKLRKEFLVMPPNSIVQLYMDAVMKQLAQMKRDFEAIKLGA